MRAAWLKRYDANSIEHVAIICIVSTFNGMIMKYREVIVYVPDLEVLLEPFILHSYLLRPIVSEVIILRGERNEVNRSHVEAVEHTVPTTARHGETVHVVGKVAENEKSYLLSLWYWTYFRYFHISFYCIAVQFMWLSISLDTFTVNFRQKLGNDKKPLINH